MSVRVSVIVPVFNTRSYLKKCVDSVLCQTFRDFELILADDGSTDGSGAICDAFQSSDSRVRVLRQENQGMSVARNNAISLARGKWLMFADSDDSWNSPELMGRLVSFAEENACEVVCFGFRRVWEDGRIGSPEIARREPTTDIGEMVRGGSYQSNVWQKLVLRDLLVRENIRFVPYVYSQDVLWSLKVLKGAARIGYLPETGYDYLIRGGSATQGHSLKYVRDMFAGIRGCLDEIPTCADAARRNDCLDYTAYYYSMILPYLHLAKPKPDRDFKKQVYAMRPLLKNRAHRVVRLIDRCCQVVGIRLTSVLLKDYVLLTMALKRKKAKESRA